MSDSARTATRRVMRLLTWLGAGLGVMALLVAGWFAWVLLLRPSPPGFAPTPGHAAAPADAPVRVLQYTIDARDKKHWAYFDFSTGSVVTTSQESRDWDLAFRRTDILTNGGLTNPGGLGGAVDLDDVPLEIATAPAEGYRTDVEHEERGLENPALHKWYDYDWTTHTISSRRRTYAVRAATGETVLLSFVSYYCANGSAGCVTFRYLLPRDP